MGMDLLRACYTTEMRFWIDRPDTVPVRWFWCDEDAEIFPGYHRFASGNWATKYGNWEGPGEVQEAPRPFDPGVNPGLDGHKFCGPQSSFIHGSPWPGKPLHANAEGLCPCCVAVIPACNVYYGSLPNVLYAKILAVNSNIPQHAGTVGQEFTFTRNVLDKYVSDIGFTVPDFFCSWTLGMDCGFHVPGQLELIPSGLGFGFPPNTVTLDPWKAVWTNIQVSWDLCSQSYGILENWTIVLSAEPL